MADARSRKLWGEVTSHLPPQWEQRLTAAHVYAALSRAQEDAAVESDCLLQTMELDLEADETTYAMPDNIHRIISVIGPAAWPTILPANVVEWPSLVALHEAETYVQRCTLRGGAFVVTPAPQEAGTLQVEVSLRPALNGDEDITADVGPMIPEYFDDFLVFAAISRLMYKIPEDLRAGYSSPEFFDVVSRAKLGMAIERYRKVQKQLPDGAGQAVWFPTG